MRFYEFCAEDPNDRKPELTLRHINRLKKVKQARREEFAKRKILMGLMYGQHDEPTDARGQEQPDPLKSEIKAMIDQAENSDEDRKHIQKMAERGMGEK